MDDREFSTEQEHLDGVRADGRAPVFHSRKLYTGATKPVTEFVKGKPLIPEPTDFPFENIDPRKATADELRYMVKLQELDDLDKIATTARELIDLGLAAGKRVGATSNSPANPECTGAGDMNVAPAPDEGADDPGSDAVSDDECKATAAIGGTPMPLGDSPHRHDPGDFEPDLRARGSSLRTVGRTDVKIPDPPAHAKKPAQTLDKKAAIYNRLLQTEQQQRSRKQGPEPDRAAYLKPEAGLVLAERGSKLLLAVTPRRTALANELIGMATELEAKEEFLWDRAHAVVAGTLLHLDEHFHELGFGSWMPFRFPDQWLSFCGVLRRVLAANGLIHSAHADVYRKLLDETPPVELEGTVHDRVKESRTPHNVAQGYCNRGAYTMSELKKRLKAEVWDPNDAWEQEQNEFWKKVAQPPP